MAGKLNEGVHYEMIPHTAIRDSRLSDKAFRLLAVLMMEQVKGERCYRSYEELKTLTGWGSFSTIKTAIKELEDLGWIKVGKGGVASNGLKSRSTYMVNVNNTVEAEHQRKIAKEQKDEVGRKVERDTTDNTDEKKRTMTPRQRELFKKVFEGTEKGNLLEDLDEDTCKWYKAVYEEGIRIFETADKELLEGKEWKHLKGMAMENLRESMPD